MLCSFCTDPPTSELYTLSLHDALPIFAHADARGPGGTHGIAYPVERNRLQIPRTHQDRKSTRLNSSHLVISYAVFCLKKKRRSTQTIATEMGVSRHDNLNSALHVQETA